MGHIFVKYSDIAGIGSTSAHRIKSELILKNLRIEKIELTSQGNMDILKTIDFSENKIQTIDLESLSFCNNLTEIFLYKNKIESIDLSPVANLKKLETINLSNNSLTWINLNPLKDCSKLSEILLHENELKSVNISPLFYCKNLDQLILDEDVNLSAYESLLDYKDYPIAISKVIKKINWIPDPEVKLPPIVKKPKKKRPKKKEKIVQELEVKIIDWKTRCFTDKQDRNRFSIIITNNAKYEIRRVTISIANYPKEIFEFERSSLTKNGRIEVGESAEFNFSIIPAVCYWKESVDLSIKLRHGPFFHTQEIKKQPVESNFTHIIPRKILEQVFYFYFSAWKKHEISHKFEIDIRLVAPLIRTILRKYGFFIIEQPKKYRSPKKKRICAVGKGRTNDDIFGIEMLLTTEKLDYTTSCKFTAFSRSGNQLEEACKELIERLIFYEKVEKSKSLEYDTPKDQQQSEPLQKESLPFEATTFREKDLSEYSELRKLPYVGPKRCEQLNKFGITSLDQVTNEKFGILKQVKGCGERMAKHWIIASKAMRSGEKFKIQHDDWNELKNSSCLAFDIETDLNQRVWCLGIWNPDTNSVEQFFEKQDTKKLVRDAFEFMESYPNEKLVSFSSTHFDRNVMIKHGKKFGLDIPRNLETEIDIGNLATRYTAGFERTTLKHMAKTVGYFHEAEELDGYAVGIMISNYWNGGAEPDWKKLLTYNVDDVKATKHVMEYMLEMEEITL